MGHPLLRDVPDTVLDDPLYNQHFAKINVGISNHVLKNTARILFISRLSEEVGANEINICRTGGNYATNMSLCIMRVPSGDFENAIEEVVPHEYQLADDLSTALHRVTKIDCKVYLDQIRDPVRPTEPVNTRHAIIIATAVSDVLYHAVAILLPRLLDGFFMAHPLTEEERVGLMAIANADRQGFMDWVERYTNSLTGIYEEMLTQSLSKFESSLHTRRITDMGDQLKNIAEDLQRYTDLIRNLMEQKRATIAMMRGLQADTTQTNELLDFFTNNPNLFLQKADTTDQSLSFWAWCWFDGGNPEATDFIFKQKHYGTLVEQAMACSSYSAEQVEKVFDALFVRRTVRIRLASYVTLHFINDDGYSRLLYYFNDTPRCPVSFDPKHLLYNPHHYIHHCAGDNYEIIADLLQTGSYVDMVAQMIAAAGQINVNENATLRPFIGMLFEEKKPVFYIKADKSWNTLDELVTYLDEEEE